MVKSVYVEQAGEVLDFPDTATPQQIQAYIGKKYGAVAPATPTPAPEAGPDESGLLGRFGYGFATGFTDIPGGIAALMYPSEEAVKTTAGQFSEEARKYLQETFGIDPTKDPTAAQQAMQALGSVGSFIMPGAGAAKAASLAGLAAKGISRAGMATAAAQGVALGASGRSQKIQQQLAAGMDISPEEQLAAQRLDGLIGIAEAAPVGRFFGPINTLLSKVPVSKAPIVERIIQSRFAKIGKAGLAEGAQEAATGIANDLVEYGVYNPDVQIGQDLLSNAGTGAFAGSFVEGVIQLAAGRKLGPSRQLQQDLATEGAANLQARRMGEISRAAEELRAAGVEGNVDVVEEEFDGLPRFVVKTPKGESVGNFTDPESAKQAIDLYQQRTGAKVSIKPPAQSVAPKAFPIKIGKKKYNSIDAIREDRDAAILQRESVAKFVTDPDLLAKKAAELKVDPDFYRNIAFGEVQKQDSLIKKLSAYLPEKREPDTAAPAEVEEPIGATPRLALPAPSPIIEEADVAATEEAEPIGGVPVAQEAAPSVSAPALAETTEAQPVTLETAPKAIPVQTGFDEAAYQAGAIPSVQPRPTTASEAEITGPFVKARTPEVEQWYTDVMSGVKNRVKGIVPGEVDVRFTELIKSPPNILIRGQVRPEQTPNGIKTIVDLSTGILRPGMTVEEAVNELVGTVNHEIVHILRMEGIWRPAEWSILSKAAAKTKVPGKKYTYLDKAQATYAPSNAIGEAMPISPVYANPDAVLEEAVAEMYKDWTLKKEAPQQTRGLFNRVTEFLRRIFRTLKDTGFEKIFRAVEAGKMLGRTPTAVREDGVRFSAAPIPAYVEAKNKTLFRPEPKQTFFQTVTDFFLAPPTEAKTLNTIYGKVEVKAGTRRAIAGRQAVVDRAAIVEFLEKTKNLKENQKFELYAADVSATAAMTFKDRASHQTISFITMGDIGVNFATPGDIQSATLQAKESPDSLLNVFRVLLEPGPVDPATGEPRDKRTIFKSYATAIRAKNKRAAGEKVPAELDDTYINTTIPFVQQNYPEVVQAYEMYQRVNKKLVTALRDSGNISDAELSALTKDMDYYGFYRELHQEELVPGVTSKTAGKFKLREYTGSEYGNLIDDPMFVMIQNAQYLISSMSRNIATTKVFNLARDMGEAKLLGATEKPDQTQGYASEVMFFKDKGVLKRFAVKDPLLVATLGADDRVDIGSTMKHIGLPASIIRETVTRDPAFMVANLLRDTVSSWITSGEDITPFLGTAKGFADALKQTASYKALMGHGVVGSYDLAMQDASQVASGIRDKLTPLNVHSVTSGAGLVSVVKAGWERLGTLSEASDAATRIAVYEAAKRQGLSDAEASFRAIRIMDFSRRGDSQILSLLTKLIPFLNARIQGLDVLYQAGRAGIRYARGTSFGDKDKNLGKQFLVRGALLAAISMAIEHLNQDDEAYENLPEYMKTGNLLIPLKFLGLEGDFLAIPKPFEAGLLFSTFPQQFYRTMTGDVGTRQNVNLFVESFGSTFGVNPIPQFLLPAVEVMTNHDFYTGLPLVSEGKARLAPELQYDSRTSTLAMVLSGVPIKYDMDTGKFTGISPITIDTLIGGYFGPFGTLVASGVGHMMELVDAGPERMPKPMTDAPVIRRFFVDAETRSPKAVAEAYELFRIVDEANRSFSRLRQSGDTEAAMDYLEENKNILAYKKYIYKLTNQLNKIGAYERQIERDKEMTRAEKLAALEKTRDMRVKLTAQIKEINRSLGR